MQRRRIGGRGLERHGDAEFRGQGVRFRFTRARPIHVFGQQVHPSGTLDVVAVHLHQQYRTVGARQHQIELLTSQQFAQSVQPVQVVWTILGQPMISDDILRSQSGRVERAPRRVNIQTGTPKGTNHSEEGARVFAQHENFSAEISHYRRRSRALVPLTVASTI